MDAVKLLKAQHDEVKKLFKQYEKATKATEKRSLFQKIADRLAAHAGIEEQLFYPAAYRDETEDLLREAVEEHLAAKRIIADLLEMKPSDDNFDAKVKVLSEQIDHHVEEEEDELFTKAKKIIKKEELEDLGTQMEELFTKLMKSQPRNEVPNETAAAAPLT